MRQWTFALLVSTVVVGGVAPLSATVSGPTCCACVVEGGAPVANEAPGESSRAVFCSVINESGEEAFLDACKDAGGEVGCFRDVLFHEDPVEEKSCAQKLADEGINCPGAPAPVMGATGIVLLLGGLSALGTIAVRRRSPRHA